MALITLSNIKTYAEITSATHDTLLTTIAAQVSQFIETLINRKLDSTTYEELYDGNGTHELMLDYFPITDIVALSLDIDKDEQSYNDPLSDEQILIKPYAGIIELFNYVFTKGKKNIYIKYTAGYTTMPPDLVMIASEMGAKKFFDITEKRAGMTSKNVLGENLTFTFEDITTMQMNIIKLYRKNPVKNGVTVTGWDTPT